MKRFLFVTLPLFILAQCLYADNIPTFNITQTTILIGINDGSGDNVFFDLTGPGISVTGHGGIGCFDWCSFNNFAPGDSLFPGVGQIFLSSVGLTIGGQTYDPDTVGLSGLSVTVLSGFTFPTDSKSPSFTVFLPASLNSPLSGSAGSGADFIQFNLKMPPGGKLELTFNFDQASGLYQFSQGQFVATTVPEPGTLGLMASGLAGMVGMIRRTGLIRRRKAN